jgi:hypothetical protein
MKITNVTYYIRQINRWYVHWPEKKEESAELKMKLVGLTSAIGRLLKNPTIIFGSPHMS